MQTVSSFSDLKLLDSIQKAIVTEGYATPTPIQAQAIPHLLDGRDLLGCAQTGTGKTAAFALPVLDRLARTPRPAGARGPRALVLTPTRELALQVAESFGTYGRNLPITRATIFGGVGQGPQVDALRRGVDIIVATPGRLLDLMEQGYVRLESVEVLVLDEADRMLDMGFIQPIRKILGALPRKRQNMLFSATMPADIADLASSLLHQPAKVAVSPVAKTADKIEQSLMFVPRDNKRPLLRELLRDPKMERVVVFTRTKHGANRVAEGLSKSGVNAEAIHGNKSQGARQRALSGFKDGRVRVLVATDLAARGLDIDAISHVINFELPNEPESYVHRIGRTARAGAEGIALSFCDGDEREYLRDIERTIRMSIPFIERAPFTVPETELRTTPGGANPQRGGGGRRGGFGGGGGGGARSGGGRRAGGGRR